MGGLEIIITNIEIWCRPVKKRFYGIKIEKNGIKNNQKNKNKINNTMS